MELRQYLRVLRRGWFFVLLLFVVGAGAGIALTVTTTPVYEATAQIFVSSSSSETGSLAGNNAFTQDRTQSYVIFARSPKVLQPTIDELKLDLTVSQLSKMVTADAPQGKVVVNLSVDNRNPNLAAALANSIADNFNKVVEESEQSVTTSGTSQAVVQLSTALPATVPGSPVSPNRVLNIGLGALIGLLLGVGVVLLRDVLDNTVKGGTDFARLGIPVLGMVPMDKRADGTPVAFRSDSHSARSEAYRGIRTNMQFVDVDNPPHLIAVTSAMPGEGKTTTAINLAAALAEAGYRVCLIDADLRRPSVASKLGLVSEVGFTTALISEEPVENMLQNAGRNLAVLTSGPVPPNPSELLITEHARTIIADIASKVDFTIIDTPPLLPVTDGAELATIADATMLVTRARKTTIDQTERAVAALQNVGEKPVGVVINMVTGRSGAGGDQYGYYYASYRPERPRRRRGRGKDEDASTAAPVEDLTVDEVPGASEPVASEVVADTTKHQADDVAADGDVSSDAARVKTEAHPSR